VRHGHDKRHEERSCLKRSRTSKRKRSFETEIGALRGRDREFERERRILKDDVQSNGKSNTQR